MAETETLERTRSRRLQVANLAPGDSGTGFARLPLTVLQALGLNEGDVIEIVSDDPTARSGLASWSRLTGNPMLAIVEDGPGRTRYYLSRK